MGYEYWITPEDYAIAEKNGISYQNVSNRVRCLGWDKQRAITEPYRETRNLKEWRKIAEQNGIGYKTLKSRIRKGMSMEEASTRPVMSKEDHWRNVQQSRLVYEPQQIARANENGVSYEIFTRRIRDGWTVEDAESTKPLTRQEASRRGRFKSEWTLGPSLFVRERVKA